MKSDQVRTVGRFRKLLGMFDFLWRERRAFILLVPLLLLLIAQLSGISTQYDTWTAWDKVLTLFTLAVGLAVFFGEAIEDWEERLSKRLTVYFQVKGVTRMVCYQAHLPHEGDIRNWGQQIGRQMCGELLEFSPYLDLRRLGIERDDREAFTHFQAIIFVTTIPKSLKDPLKVDEEATSGEIFCRVLRAGPHGEGVQEIELAKQHQPR